MNISFNYNKKQVIQALRYHFISKPEMRFMIILINAFALLCLGLYAWGKITPIAFLSCSVLWIVLMLNVWFILPLVVYKQAKTFQHAFTMYFNEADFTLEHEQRKRSWPYSSLKKYKETPHFFHLYFDSKSFLLVPKNAFNELETMQSFRALLKEKI